MDPQSAGIFLMTLAYLIGSIPFGYLTARFVKGIDIREHGSRNIGATNVGRVLGPKWGVVVLLLDLVKGVVPVVLLPQLLQSQDSPAGLHWRVGAGVATILGHMFPFWLGLRGGKGVATALGVVACLAPLSCAVAAAAFAVSFAVWRIVSLSSIVAALTFAVVEMSLLGPGSWSSARWSLGLFSIAVPVLIIFRHRSNIQRLWRGEEPRYQIAKDSVDHRASGRSN